MTVEQRLADIEGHGVGWLTEKQLAWLLSLVRSMQAVVEAAEELVEARASASKDAWLAKERLRAALQAYRRESEGK